MLRGLQLPLDRADLFLDAFLTHAEIISALQMIEQRARKRVPVAYLLREAWLQGYRFYVDERTIIPRSFIAELLKDGLAPWVQKPEEVGDVLDLCTGSGCLAVIAADVFARAQVDAVDVSPDALSVARRNIADYQLTARVQALQSDVYGDLPSKRYDIILAASDSGGGSAVVGTVVGAAAGAAIGGQEGAAVGAGTGLLVGGLAGTQTAYDSGYTLQRRYDVGNIQCMYAKGHQVPVYGRVYRESRSVREVPPSPPPGIPPPPAGMPPPPPPGVTSP